MSDTKLSDKFATPNSSKLAQILLDLRGVDQQAAGLCNLRSSDMAASAWQESFGAVPQDIQNIALDANMQDTCNCRKSRCLKLYCQCFAARATCSSSCRCLSCENRPDNAAVRDVAVNLILERNPNAFDSKYRPTAAQPMSSTFTAISGVAHKNGCRCRKSMCLKKYCECFQGGVPCSAICTCLTCQNTAPHTSLLGYQGTVRGDASTAAATAPRAFSASPVDALTSSSSTINSSSTAAKLESNAPADDDAGLEGSADALAGSSSSSCRPPLVPTNKRKRESLPPPPRSAGAADGIGGHLSQDPAGDAAEEGPAAPVLTSPFAPTLTRAQQQQLLEQLLYQELESQGLLSSPLASFVNLNCPGLLQGQGSAPSDIYSIFNSQIRRSAGDGALPVDQTPGARAADQLLASSSPALAEAGLPATHFARPAGSGMHTASPNSISIATALALLAANAQAQARAAQQVPVAAAPALALHPASLITPKEKVAASQDEGSTASHHYNGSTPMAPQYQKTLQQAASQDCTDEETLGTGSSSGRSEIAFSPLTSIGENSAAGLQRKDLFGAAEYAQTPGEEEGALGLEKQLLARGAHCRRIEQAAVKENASPNRTSLSCGVSLLR